MPFTEMVLLPSDTPYGNLNKKSYQLVQRLIHVNRRLDETEITWKAFLTQHEPGLAYPGAQHRFSADEVVVHLRRAADELIGLLWLLGIRARGGDWPNQIRVDSIGTARERNGTWSLPILERHESLLQTLNELANAHKHSFVDSEFQVVGALEPCVVALSLKNNRLDSDATPYVVSLNVLVGAFNHFYRETMAELKKLSAEIEAT